MNFDVCNGDADGLCAVLPWRLFKPQAAQLVTGLKRDIDLLAQVPAVAGDQVLVCDLSMRRNRQPVLRLLAAGMSNADIARELTVSTNTVKTHVKSIYRKLSINSREEARQMGHELNLL